MIQALLILIIMNACELLIVILLFVRNAMVLYNHKCWLDENKSKELHLNAKGELIYEDTEVYAKIIGLDMYKLHETPHQKEIFIAVVTNKIHVKAKK